jgi:hypothetical protein
MKPALGRVPFAQARFNLADGMRLTFVGGRESIENVGAAVAEGGQTIFERLNLLFRLLPALQGDVQALDLGLEIGDRGLQRE